MPNGSSNNLLLDTHAFVWWVEDNPELSDNAKSAIGASATRVHVSAVSAWEIVTKYRLGKWPRVAAIAVDVDFAIQESSFLALPLTVLHAQAAAALPLHHRDPFDRMLIAQAIHESFIVVSKDQRFDSYGVARLW